MRLQSSTRTRLLLTLTLSLILVVLLCVSFLLPAIEKIMVIEEDRGKHTLKDGYTKEQLLEVSRYFLKCSMPTDLRNRFDFLLGYSIFTRGKDKRHLQFADLFLLKLENEGPTPCFALVATIAQGKVNQHNHVSYGTTIRNNNVEACAVSALAIYFF